MSLMHEFTKGFWKDNPTFGLVLGMCPTLAITTSAFNGLGMGLCCVFVLVGSNIGISLIRNITPSKVRMPVFIVVIATFVIIIELVLKAYAYDLSRALGIFIPLIVVNCIIMGRAEAFASKNSVLPSIMDGLGVGFGFTITITIIGALREILGSGMITLFVYGDTIIQYQVAPKNFIPAVIMLLPPGGFITLGFLLALMNYINERKARTNTVKAE